MLMFIASAGFAQIDILLNPDQWSTPDSQ